MEGLRGWLETREHVRSSVYPSESFTANPSKVGWLCRIRQKKSASDLW